MKRHANGRYGGYAVMAQALYQMSEDRKRRERSKLDRLRALIPEIVFVLCCMALVAVAVALR